MSYVHLDSHGGCLTWYSWSLRASLYEPYIGIYRESDAASWLLNALALRSMREAAFLAARQAWKLLTTTAVVDIPLSVYVLDQPLRDLHQVLIK